MTSTLTATTAADRRPTFVADLRDVEWRTAGNGTDYTFSGAAVVFNSWSEELWTPLGVFRERILPGAFTRVLAENPDVRLLLNHDSNYVLARTRSGSLELREEANALRVYARVAPTSYAKDLRMSMARGDIDQMSFAFSLDLDKGGEDRWYEEDDTGEIRRDIVAVSALYDVSPVTFPAYPDTSAVMRELRSAVAAGRFAPARAAAATCANCGHDMSAHLGADSGDGRGTGACGVDGCDCGSYLGTSSAEPGELVEITPHGETLSSRIFLPTDNVLTVVRDAAEAEFPTDPIVARAETNPEGETAPTAAPPGADGDPGDQAAPKAGQGNRLHALREEAERSFLRARAGHHELLRQFKP